MKYIATSVVAMLLLSGCDNTQSNNSSPSETEVGVVTLKSQPVSVVSELTGRTSAALSAEVRPQVGGIIQKRLFKEGDLVKAGQPLYQIDAASYQAAWNEARAVTGLNPVAVTTKILNNGRVAQLNRVADYGSAGYRFESCRDHKKDYLKR